MRSEQEDALVRGLLSALAAFRWVAWGWLATLLVLTRSELDRPLLAVGLAGAALAVTVAATAWLRREPERLLSPMAVAVEVAVAVALSVGDGLAYAGPHPQSLGSAWPLAGILTAGVAFAGRGGATAGVVVGVGRLTGTLLEPSGGWDDGTTISALSTIVLYALAGGVAGFATVKLREAERRISIVQAREEVARTLHDGVLQTLAVVQRRTGDAELAHLAREQERELREYLFGTGASEGGGDVGTRLRAAAAQFEDRFGGGAQVVVAPDLPDLGPAVVEALGGAVAEALTNAGKHGGASKVTVYIGPDDASGVGILCSVKDDGSGFDDGGITEGVGMSRSMRARMAEVGGRTDVDGNPGHGTEVRFWVPA